MERPRRPDPRRRVYRRPVNPAAQNKASETSDADQNSDKDSPDQQPEKKDQKPAKKKTSRAWLFLLVIPVLLVFALFDDHFNFINPFKDHPKENINVVDSAASAVTEDDTLNTTIIASPDSLQDEAVTDSIQAKPEPQPVSTEKRWRLVVASLRDEGDAEEMLSRLSSEGKEVRYIARLNTYRVVYDSFGNLKQAQDAYDRISNQYPKAWLVYF